jgi:hypothetical protein
MRAVIGVVAGLLASCTSETPGALRAQCARTSDCRSPLVCAGERCRAECREDRDCTDGAQCYPVGPGVSVCVPPEEPVPCGLHSDCADGAYCIAGTCRAQCREDRDCADGSTCDLEAGACTRPIEVPPAPDAGAGDGDLCTPCGARCVNLQIDPGHCGACGIACAPGEVCAGGVCARDPACGPDELSCCPGDLWLCDGECVNLQIDARHCGACGRTCATRCSANVCSPTNDDCENANPIDLRARSARVTGDQRGSTDSPGSCTDDGDRFYRFTLARRELVVALLTGEVFPGGVGIVTSCGSVPAGCVQDERHACGFTTQYAWAVLDPADYRIVVDGAAVEGGTGAFTLDVFHVPVSSGDAIEVVAPTTYDGSLAGAAPPAACGAGPERVLWGWTCPEGAGAAVRVTTCGVGATPTALEVATGRATVPDACDPGAACGAGEIGASVTTSVSAGVDAFFVRVRGRDAGSTGPVSVTFE